MINGLKFNLNMIKKFERKYPQIPTEILVDIIDIVLNRASSIYFDYDQIQEHQELCIMCGKCCQGLACKDFNGKTCDAYDSRYDACREYPSYEFLNGSGLILDCECHFANRLAEVVLDDEFQKNLGLLSFDSAGEMELE